MKGSLGIEGSGNTRSEAHIYATLPNEVRDNFVTLSHHSISETAGIKST